VNGAPIHLLQPEILQMKSFEPFLLIGMDKFAAVSDALLCERTTHIQ